MIISVLSEMGAEFDDEIIVMLGERERGIEADGNDRFSGGKIAIQEATSNSFSSVQCIAGGYKRFEFQSHSENVAISNSAYGRSH